MLGSKEIVETVAASLKTFMPAIVILDPVMISKSGHHLLDEKAVSALKVELLPLATLVTPNVPEAEVLTGFPIRTKQDFYRACISIQEMGPKAVLLKGGHAAGNPNDLFMMVLTSTGSRESAFIQGTLMVRAAPYHPPLHLTWQMDCHCKSRSNRPRPIFPKRYAIAFQSVKVMDLSIIFIHIQKRTE